MRSEAVLVVLLALAAVAGVAAEEQPPRSVVVGVKEAPPFVMRGEDGTWRGLSIKLWEEIAERRGLDYEYVEYDLAGLFGAVEAGEVDIGVGALTMTPEREARFDFTHPYFTAGLGIAVERDRGAGWLSGLRAFFSLDFLRVILLLAVVLLGCGFLVWLFERRRNPEMFGERPSAGVGAGFWWAAVTMTTVGYGDKVPITPAGRLVALAWMFTSLLILSFFTAAIASALTVGALGSSINGPEDLPGVRVMSIPNSTSEQWLDSRGIAFVPIDSVETGLTGLVEDRGDAVVYDSPILRYLVRRKPESGLMVLPGSFDRESYAFALPEGSRDVEAINREILEITGGEAWRSHVRSVIGVDS